MFMTISRISLQLRTMLPVIVVITMIAIVLPANAIVSDQDQSTADDTIEVVKQVIDLYFSGNIDGAEHLALRALDNPNALSRLDRFNLYKILAFCAVANDDVEGGIRRFKSALSLDPNIAVDPITWSPKVRHVLELARSEYDKQAKGERSYRLAIEAEICRNASLKSLYLPGSGQISKGHKWEGWIVGSLFWCTTATFVYSQLTLPTARNRYDNAKNTTEAVNRWEDYRDTYRINLISGTVAVSIYTYTFLDALWRRPSVVRSAEE